MNSSTNRCRASFQITLTVLLQLSLVGCGGGSSGGGGHGGEPNSGDGSYIEIRSSTLDGDCDQIDTLDCHLEIYGDVFNEYFTNSHVGSCSPAAGEIGVRVLWQNLNTGDSGLAHVYWGCDRLWDFQTAMWRITNIPLVWGQNRIVITANGTSGRTAETGYYKCNGNRDLVENFEVNMLRSSAVLSWDNDSTVSSYNVYYLENGTRNRVKISGASNPTTIDDLNLGRPYTFSVNAVRDCAESASRSVTRRVGWYRTDLSENGVDAEITLDSFEAVHILDKTIAGIGNYWTNAPASWVSQEIDVWTDNNSDIDVDLTQVPHVVSVDGTDLKYSYLDFGNWVVNPIELGRVYIDPHIVIASNGDAHVAYYADDQVMYATNTTGSWQTYQLNTSIVLSGGLDKPLISIKLDANENVHIAYVSKETNWKIYYAANSSGQWEHTIVESSRYLPYIDMDIDLNGYIHLVYLIQNYTTGTTLKYATNQSGGWTIEVVHDHFSTPINYTIAADSQGFMHIGLVNAGLYYSDNKSGEWNLKDETSKLWGGANDIYSIDMKLDATDRAHFVFANASIYRNGWTTYLTNREH